MPWTWAPSSVAAAAAAAVAEDEPEQRPLDEQEDRAGEDRDPEVAVVDQLGVRGGGLDRREAAVARERDAGEREAQSDGNCEETGARAAIL